MPRFFITASDISGSVASIGGADAVHMKALRVKPNENITLCDGLGNDYSCRLLSLGEHGAEVEILEKTASLAEPDVKCSVFAAFPKGDKAESIVQKSVELGAYEIVFFPSERCVSRPEGTSLAKKLARFQKISEEAAKQSGRGILPQVTAADSFRAAMTLAAASDASFFLYEEERAFAIKDALDFPVKPKTISIVTGPEGGFEPSEKELAVSLGLSSVTMGPRILRCETAPLCALSAVMLMTNNL